MEAPASRPWKRALLWLSFLGPFFFASYGFANWVASRRPDVGAIVFDWEQRIPFLPWTIVPYWSIDVLYAFSLFICTTRRELDVHARRLLYAQLLCVTVFLAFPLRFTFERPETRGFFGLMFDVLMGFDKPFNQMPSLHIALLVVIWLRYLRHVPRSWRWVVHAWGVLIALSVLTTFQHHFIDIVTGVWVGWLCVWLFPEDGRRPAFAASSLADTRRRVLATCYAAAAVATGAIAIYLGGWGLWLLWVAGSIAAVAVIYAFMDEAAFQKAGDGSMSTAAWWLLGPYFAAAWLNSRWWTRARPNADAIVPGLWLGRVPAARDCNRYHTVVDMSVEMPCANRGTRYVNVPQLDLTAPTLTHIERAVAAIDAGYAEGPVLVCCALGYSRSAVAVAAWLIASGRAVSAAAALALLREARPAVVIHGAHLDALEQFARQRNPACA